MGVLQARYGQLSPHLVTAASQHFRRGKAVGAAGFPLKKQAQPLYDPFDPGNIVVLGNNKGAQRLEGLLVQNTDARSEGCRLL